MIASADTMYLKRLIRVEEVIKYIEIAQGKYKQHTGIVIFRRDVVISEEAD
jgi:hypothetical protein